MVEASLSGLEPLALSWNTLLAFLRISTSPRILLNPFSIAEAVAIIVAGWTDRTSVAVLGPGERHWEILRRLLVEGQAAGPLVTDAHLAALAIEHGAILATADRDFARFAGLRLLNPLTQDA